MTLEMKPAANYMKTILLIDDDEDDCLLLSHALAAVSNNVVLSCTQTIDRLFETIDGNKPSLILIDYYMPKRNGLDLAKQIKSHPEYKDMPVVMWSSCDKDDIVEVDNKKELQHFFQKPCSYTEFIDELRKILFQNGIGL
jgi:DNA-binding NtrC family response regulator